MNSHKKSILLIGFFCFITSCKLAENTEKEPNNTFSNANTIEINKEITGFLESETDIDNFTLNIDEEQILKTHLSGIKGVNHSISIYKNIDSKLHLIKVIDDNRKSSSETFSNLYVQPGQYIFSLTHGSRDIKKGNTETPYKLLITSKSFMNEEKEPNDNPYSATDIADKSAVMGYFSPAQNSLNNELKNKMKEMDWYKFNISLTDNNPILIDLALSGVEGVDSTISILNGAMEELITADNAATGEGETIADFGIRESGAYYALVSSKNFLSNHDRPYEIKLDVKQYDINSELESNNTFEKSNNMVSNTIRGKIAGNSDIDFFHFIPSFKNKFYRAMCSGSEGLDIVMTIYDSNRNKLFDINNNKSGQSEKIPCFIIKNSVYISVSAASISGPESMYNLDIENYGSDEDIEIEPNNTKTTANTLDNKVTGFITYKNDIDYYLLKFEDRKKIRIEVKGAKNGKIRISTTDQLGFIIKSKDIGPDEKISITEIIDKKGYIIIESLSPDFESPYNLTLEEL